MGGLRWGNVPNPDQSWSSSEDNLPDESDSNLLNLYDNDVEKSVEHSESRLYQFEPRRVRQSEQQEASPEPYYRIRQQPGPSWKHRLILNHFAIKLHF